MFLSSCSSPSKFVKIAHLYYEKIIGPDNRKLIVAEVFQWLLMDDDDVQNLPRFKERLIFWKFQVDQYPKWSFLARTLLSTVSQSADCERIFKDWARFHTDTRNRLRLETTNFLVQCLKFQLRSLDRPSEDINASVRRIILPTELERETLRLLKLLRKCGGRRYLGWQWRSLLMFRSRS